VFDCTQKDTKNIFNWEQLNIFKRIIIFSNYIMVYKKAKRTTRYKKKPIRKPHLVPYSNVRENIGSKYSQPFGQRYFCTLSYGLNDDLGASAVSSITYRANSVYDPPLTASTDQPYYYDQISPLYLYYRVYAITYDIYIMNDTNHFGAGWVQFSMVTTVPTSTRQIFEDRLTRYKIFGPKDSGQAIARIKGKININDIAGVSKIRVMNDDVFASQVTNNPSRQAYLHIGGVAEQETVDAKVFGCIKYHVVFSEPVLTGSS